MSTRIVSHAAVAATALVVGGLGATAFSNPEPTREGSAVPAQTVPPEQVRTVVVTKTIHRVRRVHVRAHRSAPVAAAPAPVVAAAPAPVPVATRRPVALRPSHPLQTRTSGHGGSGGGEHEGGGDD